MNKKVLKVVTLLLVCSIVLSLLGCAQNAAAPSAAAPAVSTAAPAPSEAPSKSEEPAKAEPSPSPSPEKVTLKLFTNLPDRNAGQGKLEQLLIDNYLAANKNVAIEVEALQDEPYKQKFKAYTSSDKLPDIFSVWGQPSFIDPVINSGYLAELNAADYEKYNFLPGSLNGFSKNEKIYGLPRNTDIMVFYYNKAIFKEKGISVPTTLDELIAIGGKLKGSNIAPIDMTGKDKWPICIMFTDFVMRYTGDNSLMAKAVAAKDFSSEPRLLEAAKKMEQLNKAGLYQKSFTATDYGAGRNMFAQGKAAMYYMGSWEMGMVNDTSLPEDFRKNIGVFVLPAIPGATGKVTDIAAWNGGGYAVSEKSPVKAEAIKFLNYIFAPENWAKNAWQLGICFPAQKFDEFMTGEETEVQKTLIDVLGKATSISGTTVNDLGTPAFKTASEDLAQQFASGMITAEQFIAKLTEAAKQ
jgi:raffinose/stachyose/melibiose transport system substrate-binding protein